MKLEIKFDSGAAKLISTSKGIESRLMGRMNAAFIRCGGMIQARMRDSMANGGWHANAPSYRKWKKEHGWDMRPLFRTHILANSISYIPGTKSPALMSGHVGWHPGATYPGNLASGIAKGRMPNKRKRSVKAGKGRTYSNATLETVAAQNELTRPFIERTYETVQRDVVAIIQKAFYSALNVGT